MSAKRVLIIANEAVADRPAGVPDVVRRTVLEADEVRLVAPTLTTRLQSWTSDIDGAACEADQRASAIVGSIHGTGQTAAQGTVGDEDPLQAIADIMVDFEADAIILAVRVDTRATFRERRLGQKVRTRFQLPVIEMGLDDHGRVVYVADDTTTPTTIEGRR
jgi:hypothetical protein